MASVEREMLLNTILDLGASLIRSGADIHKTEKNLYRICAAYGFTDCNIWVIPSNIQASVTDKDGETYTHIRHVRNSSTNYTMLADLNQLARSIYEAPADQKEFRERYDAIMNAKPQNRWIFYLAGILGGVGFGVFFNCDLMDAIVAMCASLIVAVIGRSLGRYEKNPIIFNFILSFISEVFIITAVHFGMGHNIGYITIGVVMLLISGIGATNGAKDLMHLDTVSGVLKLSESILGAMGIAAGMGLALFLFKNWSSSEIMMLNPSAILGLAFCTIGCVGFGLWFNVKWKHIPFCGIGAFITCGVYILMNRLYPSDFAAVLAASVVCAAYAQIVSRLIKAPSTIFMSLSIYPVVPGAALFYTMYGIVTSNINFAIDRGISLVTTCVAIVLGIMVVEAAVRLVRKLRGRLPAIE